MGRDTCKLPTCDDATRDTPGYEGRFCSSFHELKYEHIKADAMDAKMAEYEERQERAPEGRPSGPPY